MDHCINNAFYLSCTVQPPLRVQRHDSTKCCMQARKRVAERYVWPHRWSVRVAVQMPAEPSTALVLSRNSIQNTGANFISHNPRLQLPHKLSSQLLTLCMAPYLNPPNASQTLA